MLTYLNCAFRFFLMDFFTIKSINVTIITHVRQNTTGIPVNRMISNCILEDTGSSVACIEKDTGVSVVSTEEVPVACIEEDPGISVLCTEEVPVACIEEDPGISVLCTEEIPVACKEKDPIIFVVCIGECVNILKSSLDIKYTGDDVIGTVILEVGDTMASSV